MGSEPTDLRGLIASWKGAAFCCWHNAKGEEQRVQDLLEARAETWEAAAEGLEKALREASPAVPARLLNLARRQAQRDHIEGLMLGTGVESNGHVGYIGTCPHPDCVLVRGAGLSQGAPK